MTIGEIFFYIKSVRFIPAYIIARKSKNESIIFYELNRWLLCNNLHLKGMIGFLTLMMKFPEYRSLVYFRTGHNWLRHLGHGQYNLYFHTPSNKIGKGLIIWHGYSTVINASAIGEDCSIWHNVTIGKKNTLNIDDKPTIGNGVSICTGAIVLGDIRISDGTIIGAGSVVVNDIIKYNSLVVGAKAKIKK